MRIETLKSGFDLAEQTYEDYLERSKYVSYTLGDGTLARDTERILEGLNGAVAHFVNHFDLTESEEQQLLKYLDIQRRRLNAYEERADVRYTEQLHEFED